MQRTVKCGLIQATNAAPTNAGIEEIKRENVEKHLKLIEDAAAQGVQILCMQEVFTTPYFCAEQQTRWYEANTIALACDALSNFNDEVRVGPSDVETIPMKRETP